MPAVLQSDMQYPCIYAMPGCWRPWEAYLEQSNDTQHVFRLRHGFSRSARVMLHPQRWPHFLRKLTRLTREEIVIAFQDYYPDELSYCYGCGRLNEHGLRIRSFWDGEETVATFVPNPHHMAIPGYVYGGILASIIDCHGTGTAAAAAYRVEQRAMGTEPPIRFLTASLHVDYLRPTPLGVPLEIRGRVKEFKGRKVLVNAAVSADGQVCVRGEVVAVQVPKHWLPGSDASQGGRAVV
jgi:acyl-coenzyme A thioesterase PaaI-like protein